jgi:116 kDa U5 small nuclear ribonucleoprotein component
MVSLEDYDEFGNYIGADLDADDEDEVTRDGPERPAQLHTAPLEGFDDEPTTEQAENSLMEIDGMAQPSYI